MTDDRLRGHDEWDELAAGHALHALEPDDQQRFLDHLTGCERCAANIDDYSLVAAQLGSLADTEPGQPPTWQDIRTAIVTDRSEATLTPLAQRRSHRRGSRLLAAAAAAVLLAGGGVAGWQLTRGSAHSPSELAALTACEQQPRCRVIHLHTPDGGSPAAVIVNTDRVAVVPLTLAVPPSGHTYVLWQMPRDGGPIPVTEFRDAGRQTAIAPLPSDYRDTAAFAISIESSSTPPARPTHIVAVGTAT